jgi:hypothetical protein
MDLADRDRDSAIVGLVGFQVRPDRVPLSPAKVLPSAAS